MTDSELEPYHLFPEHPAVPTASAHALGRPNLSDRSSSHSANKRGDSAALWRMQAAGKTVTIPRRKIWRAAGLDNETNAMTSSSALLCHFMHAVLTSRQSKVCFLHVCSDCLKVYSLTV
jgi:hypothetical protein